MRFELQAEVNSKCKSTEVVCLMWSKNIGKTSVTRVERTGRKVVENEIREFDRVGHMGLCM